MSIPKGFAMGLPINLDNLLNNRTVESNRIEYKKGWNPLKVLHTVCAFANDYEDSGGGYVIIGVNEEGIFPGEVYGLTEKEVDQIENELMKYCSMIEPPYLPEMSVESYMDRRIVVIWAASDCRRPFNCPVSLRKEDDRDTPIERGYYIRRMSHTVRAKHDEESKLREMARRIQFDEMANRDGTTADIRRYLVDDYLNRIDSSLSRTDIGNLELYRSMRLLDGPSENRKPLNIALMMFSDDVERFFPHCRIEVAIIHDEEGDWIDNHRFTGPVDIQLIRALNFLKSSVITERIYKVEGQAESERMFNYPLNAVEEALTNAVYHKSYEIPEPIKVYVYPDRIEITSLPGPDPSISDEEIENLTMFGSFYRNKRLGDFLKELELTEGRNTGMKKIVRAMDRNGSNKPIYKTDANRSYLRVILPVHHAFLERRSKDMRPDRRPRMNPDELKKRIVDVLENEGCLTTATLSAKLGYSSVTQTLRRCIAELIEEGELEYLIPGSPRSSKQRICRAGRRCR